MWGKAETTAKSYKNFTEFYCLYLSQHENRICRRLHFIGSSLALLCLAALVVTQKPLWLGLAIVCGYGFAWIGHFCVDKAKPVAFRHPLYSFMGNWLMYGQMWTGKIRF